MGDIGSMISNAGGALMSGAQTLGTDLFQGFQDIGQGIGGLFGGGGAVSPGTIGATGANVANAAAPNLAGAGAGIASAIPSAASTAAGFEAAPGLTTDALQGIVSHGMSDPSLAAGISGAIPAQAGTMMDMAGGLTGGITAPEGLRSGGFLHNLLSNPELMKGIIPGLGMINAMTQKPPGLDQLKAMEAEQAGMAKNQSGLAMAEQQGLLPAGAQQMFQGQLQAAEAAIRAKYAQMGMTGSTAEMQDLQAAREGVIGQMFSEGQNMAKQSWDNYNNATGYKSQLLEMIMLEEMQKQKQFQEAMANMASAFTK